jgi:hypothetical protein
MALNPPVAKIANWITDYYEDVVKIIAVIQTVITKFTFVTLGEIVAMVGGEIDTVVRILTGSGKMAVVEEVEEGL